MWKRRKEKKNTKNQKKSRDRKGHGASFACFHSHSIRIAETLKTYPAARLLSRMIHARLQTGRHLLLVVSIHGIYERKWFFFDATNRILNESKKKKKIKGYPDCLCAGTHRMAIPNGERERELQEVSAERSA